ncbi:hypothetical protein GCM10027456_55040 [Kineosporia babensis]
MWLAHDESLDAEVAVKVMADNWADRMDLRERFLGEARMLRQAASQRIVQVFDIGELEDGRPYLVMEYADAGTLADRVKANGAYPLAEALRVTAEVARGVAELHDAGVVHRDLKPSNVLVKSTRGGGERLLVADLGVAKSLAQGSGVTMSVGSAGYMAPEQMEPQIGVDVRADVYSLGAFAFYLMTAQKPYLPLVMAEKMPAALPDPVLETMLSALERDREMRWPDAASLAERFDELADQLPDDFSVSAASSPTDVQTPYPSAPVAAAPDHSPTPDSPTPGWTYEGGQKKQPALQNQAFEATRAAPSRPTPMPQRAASPQSAPPQPQYFQEPQPGAQGFQQGPGDYGRSDYPQQGPGQYQGYSHGYSPSGQQQGYSPNQPSYPQGQPGYPQGAQQPPRPPAESLSSRGGAPRGGVSRGEGRGRWIATMVVVVALAAATGVGSVMFWQKNRNQDISVSTADQSLRLTVPKQFGREVVDNGWKPTSIGLKDAEGSGLLLANDVDGWSKLQQDVDGVFVGLSPRENLPKRVAEIEHEDCTKASAEQYTGPDWEGQLQTWTSCSGGQRVLWEISLKAVDSDQWVYMQVRQSEYTVEPAVLIEGLELTGS